MNTNSNNNSQPKGQPKATPEVAQMLGLKIETVAASAVPMQRAPEGLPVVEVETATTETVSHEQSVPAVEHEAHAEVAEEVTYDEAKYKSMARTILPYAAIFLVGIFLYYFYFSTFSFTNVTDLFKKTATTKITETLNQVENDKDSALAQLKTNNLDAYYEYMRQFYFDTSDASVTDPDKDNSGNGLTNFQKFLLGLNPKVYDTLGNGQADSQALAAGIDPYTGSGLSGKRKELVDNYIDLEVANNKLTQNAFQNPRQNSAVPQSQVAGTNIIGARNAGASSAGVINLQPVSAPAPVSQNRTTPAPAVNGAKTFSAPATGPAPSEAIPGQLLVNDAVNATLNIPALKITVPIVWTKDTKDFDRDLKYGVVHYPGTAMPGEIGTSYISGHSSNYAWKKGNYNRVFDTLDRLKVGDSFSITVTLKNGSKAKLHYKVIKQQQYQPNDQAQLDNGSKSVVALSTCWPIGTTARRLVDFGELTQIER